jgi:hypothetical protein
MATPRQRELQKRAQRHRKLAALRRRFSAATSEEQRSHILRKVILVAPTLRIDDFLATVRAR